MPIFNWNETYSVKINVIDVQHKKLFDLINNLHDAMILGKGKEVMGTTLDALMDYTKVHFADEEKLLAANKYPDLAVHKIEHDFFVQQIFEMQTKFKAGKFTLTIDLMNFLRDWLINHIMKKDQKYTPYIKA